MTGNKVIMKFLNSCMENPVDNELCNTVERSKHSTVHVVNLILNKTNVITQSGRVIPQNM